MSQSEWFEKWFQDDYLVLYSNRNPKQALSQVNALLHLVGDFKAKDFILDLGCGTGRHLKVLQSRHTQSIGVDLSPTLLNEANKTGCQNLIRADFRSLPFKANSIKMVCSFFSSFGYFEKAEDDWDFFNVLSSLVQNDGYLFLDLPNGPYTVSHLPPDDVVTKNGTKYSQKRRWDGERIIKKISIERSTGEKEEHHEKLRLFSYANISNALEERGFKIIQVFGNEFGNTYERGKSPRMSFVAKRTIDS